MRAKIGKHGCGDHRVGGHDAAAKRDSGLTVPELPLDRVPVVL